MILYFCILNLFLLGYYCQDSPCYDGWTYSKINGKCYLNQLAQAGQPSSNNTCSKALPSDPNTPVRLIRIQNANDVQAVQTQMISIGNNAPLWMDATLSSAGQWLWSDGSVVDINMLQSLVTNFNLNGSCLTFLYNYANVRGSYQLQYTIQGNDCTSSNSYICEHASKPCDINILPMQPDSMQIIPNTVFVQSYVYVSCKPGYYRPSELPSAPPAQQAGPVNNNYAYCTGTQDSSKNPSAYKATWNFSKIEICQQVSCAPFSGVLNNVQSQISNSLINSQTSFNFGYSFSVTCQRGFVNYADSTSWTSSLVCQQSTTDKTQGIWTPINYTPCVSIKCNMSVLTSMIPGNAALQVARSKITQQLYDVTFQASFIPLFNNIIDLQCIDGFFYPDRSWIKQVICDLNNNSLISGSWQGYMGTILPLFSSCQNVTCKYESIVVTTNMNLQPFVQIMNNVGAFVNQTQPTGNPYPYQTQLLFTCLGGYSTATAASTQTLICGPQGNWIPNLTPCISIIAPLDTGKAKHYTPPAKEASTAQQIGFVAIVIMVIFLSLIVILDMSTLARDVKVMQTNIKRLRAAIRRRRQNQD